MSPASATAEKIFARGGETGRALSEVDWAATPLGPTESWPSSLCSALAMMLPSRFSMWMAWGSDLTFFCNDAYRRDTLGAKFPWALGRPASDVWSEIWSDIGPRIERVLQSGEATWEEALMLFLERSGYQEETYHTFSYSPLSDDEGSVVGMLCVVSEDTDRVIGARRMATLRDLGSEPNAVRTEKEVLESSARQLAGNGRDLPFTLFYIFDPDGSSARLRASSGIVLPHPAAPERIESAGPTAPPPVAALAAGRDPGVIALDADRSLPSGTWDEPPLRAVLVPFVRHGQDRPAGFFVAGLNRYRPLDEGYRTFLELVARQVAAGLATARGYEGERHRAEQLAELDKTKTAFFANVSHEFRTPLTLLLGPAEDALADEAEPLPAGQRGRLETVRRNARRLLKLVNTLLDFSQLEAGRVEPRLEPVDLARYTAELAGAFAGAAERVGLVLEVRCPALEGPAWVDREMWAKVVSNLLSNALKFTFEGTISVVLRDEGDDVELVVADTGVGIAPEEQSRLFERFYRVTSQRARTHEGSGIGLALVAELVGLHAGSVTVASTPGRGTEFTVRLPRRGADFGAGEGAPPQDDTPAPEPDATQQAAGYLAEIERWGVVDPAPTPWADGGARPRVLVIDDNADMREYLAGLLNHHYAVTTASDGATGVALARDAPPDLVLSDVMMPGLDGFGVLGTLRGDPTTEHVPVVLLSARAGSQAAVEGLEAGADDYLVKPFTARELLARIRANLELDRARRIRARLERFQVLLDQTQRLAGIGSWEYDLDSGSLTGSDEMLRQLQLRPEEMSGNGLSEALSRHAEPSEVDRLLAAVDRAVTTGENIDSDLHVRTEDGSLRTYRTLGEVVRDERGRVVRLRGSNQDVTEQRAAERALAAAAAAREAAAREHRIADELQRRLVPAPSFTPDNLAIATYYRPGVEGTQVGGDWYDVIELGAGRTALVLGDVMGRGVQAAAVMGQLRASIRAYAQLDLPPVDVLGLLDRAVRDLGDDQIVTCVYAVYDPSDRTLSYANAGHLPPVLRLAGSAAAVLSGGGPPLGIGPVAVGTEQLHLPEGSLLALYTDGLVERRGSDLDDGIGRLAGLLGGFDGTLEQLPERLVAELLPDGPDDDVAVLVALARDHAAPTRSASLGVEWDERAVGDARRFVGAHLADWGVDGGAADDVILVASELVTNAVLYGKGPIELRLHTTRGHVVVQVLDATPYLPRPEHPATYDEHGRGLQIVARVATRWGARPTVSGKAVWCELPTGVTRSTGVAGATGSPAPPRP